MQANSLKLGLDHNYYETLDIQKVIKKNPLMVFLSQEVNHKWELPPKVIQQAPTTEIGRGKTKSISQHTGGPQLHQQTNYYMRKQQTKRVIYDSTNCLSSQINRSSSNRLKKLHSVSSNNCINYESFLHNFDDNQRIHTNQGNVTSDINKGKILFSENKTEEALEIFSHYLTTYGQHPDALYLSGLCYISICETDKAIEQLQQLVHSFPTYKRNAFILLAVSLKKKDKVEEAVNILTQAIKHFNRYFDAYIYRGKMYLKLKQIDKAVKDFIAAINQNPKKSVGHMGLCECYKATNQLHLAIEECSNALNCDEDSQRKSILIKRFLLYLESRDYPNAKNDIQMLIEQAPADSEVYYFKGILMYKQKRLQDALLAFEQAIKNNSDKKPVTKSLYEIVKIKIEQNDFYQAQHELNRAAYLDIETAVLEKFIMFVEGVIFLMKRKFEEGTASLTMMITKNQQSDHMKFQAHQYRAYGYFCQSKYHLALQDLELYQENLLEKSSIYNKLLCYGIITCEDNDLEQSKSYFLQAQKMLPNKMEPLFYLAILQIKKYSQYSEKLSEENRIKCLNEAQMLLQKAQKIVEASNLLFYKGIVNFAIGNLEEAQMDLEMAIDKSEDNQGQHYYVRGLLHCYRQMYREAVNDFSICISLDQNHAESFLNRCKLLIMIGDSTSGYLDLQKYLELKNNLDIDYNNVGVLFYQIGAFEEAITAFNMYSKDKESQYSKVKVLVYIKELNQAINELMEIINFDKDQYAIVDHSILTVLKQASQTMNDEILKECIHNLNLIEQEGLIFKKSDIFFYKSVFQLFRKKYADAKDSLIQSYNYKQQEMSEQPNPSSLYSQNCFEDFDFTNKTFNLYEHLYNSSIYDIMLGLNDQAFQTLSLLDENLAQKEYKLQIQLLMNILKDDVLETPINEQYAKMTDFQLFNQHNRLCSIFPSIQLPLKKYKLAVRLSFCLPTIEFNVQPILFDEGLLSKISPKIVENKPEAPWIKRSSQGVIFTENIQLVEDIDLQSTVRETNEEDQQEINNISQLKEKLKLDEQVAQKLNSIMKQREESAANSHD